MVKMKKIKKKMINFKGLFEKNLKKFIKNTKKNVKNQERI